MTTETSAAPAPPAPTADPSRAAAAQPFLKSGWKKSDETEIVLEQYKLFVEMTERTIARRDAANGFFLTLHTAIATAVAAAGGLFLDKAPTIETRWPAFLPACIACAACWAWYRRIKSYRQLNSGKFKVIHEYEKHLPTSPYAFEWNVLGEGKDKERYVPLTLTEKVVPWSFFAFYIVAAALFVIFGGHVSASGAP